MCSTLGTCTVSGGTVSVEFRANNVPIGTAITFETSSDSGATWGVSTTVTCSNSISQYVGLLGVAGVCPGFTAAAGVFTCVSNATIRARMKVASAVIPNCI